MDKADTVGTTAERKCTGAYKCPYPECRAEFFRSDMLAAHVCIHVGQRDFVCHIDHCNKAYTRPHHLRRHIEAAHNQKWLINGFKCSEEGCGKTLKTLLILKQHYKNAHPDNFLKMHPHKCAHCSVHFATAASLACHEYTHTGVSYSDPPPISKPTGRHKCQVADCQAEFSRPNRLAAHMSVHASQRDFVCQTDGCKKAYTRQQHLHRHIETIHCRKPVTMEVTCAEKGCEKSYKSLASIKRHYEQAHTDKFKGSHPHKCPHCDMHFTTANKLARHQYTHTGIAPYMCDICEKKFTDITLFKKHLRSVHKKKSFKCPEKGCTKVFPKFSLLKEHKITHQKDTDGLTGNQDSKCKKKSNSNSETRKECNQQDIFVCPHGDCQRSYSTRFNLKQHILRIHEGKKLACQHPGCGKSLATKQKLQEHIKKLHDPDRPAPLPKYTVRNQRKDAGKPKRSMAVKLSGVQVPYQVEKSILQEKTFLEDNENYEVCEKVLHGPEGSPKISTGTEELPNEKTSHSCKLESPVYKNKKNYNRLDTKAVHGLFLSTDGCESECQDVERT